MLAENTNLNFQEKFLNFFKKNLKTIILISIFTILIIIGLFFYKSLKEKKDILVSEMYIEATILLKQNQNNEAKNILENVINKNNKFYSPLALYFIIDNNLENNSEKIVNYFDQILKIKNIDKDHINLIKIKKAIYLFKFGSEEQIIKTLNPVINSDSSWRVMAINLISEYFVSRGQKVKADEYLKLLNN